MALSGKDTGGSPWFVTHSPQRIAMAANTCLAEWCQVWK